MIAGLSIHKLVMLLLLTGLGGFVDSVAGGGALISLPAYMLAGFPPHVAIATNKVSAGMGVTTAAYRYARSGYVRWKLAAFTVAAALIGGSLGARISLIVSDEYFKILMLVILPVTAFVVMRGKVLDENKEELSLVRTVVIGCGIALGVGMYDGFYGPGSGTFMLLLLTGAAHLPLDAANANAKIINFFTCLSSLTVYLLSGNVVIIVGLLAGITSVAGAYIGTRMFDKSGIRIVRPVIIIVIAIFMIKILLEIL